MAKSRRRTFGEKLATSQQHDFVGRQAQLDHFRSNLALGPEQDGFLNLFHIHGQGGVGKTTLLREFEQMAKEKGYASAFIDTEDQDLFAVTVTLHRLAKQLEQQGGKFTKFFKRHKDYLQAKGQLEADPERPKGTLGSLVTAGLNLGGKAVREVIPGAGILVSDELIKTGARVGGDWLHFVARKLTNKDDVELVLAPLQVLTPLWLEGFNELMDQQPVLLAFDTYEIANAHLDTWLRELLQQKYGELYLDFIIVIAGRSPLEPTYWSTFKAYLSSISLAPFTPEEALAYLQQKGFTDQEEMEQVLAISNRLPVYLSLLAESGPGQATENDNANDQIVERFLKHIQVPLFKTLAIKAALPRKLNQDIVRVLVEQEELGAHTIQSLFDWLIRRPFVQKRGGHWAYHPMVRESVHRFIQERSPQTWQHQQEVLATTLAKQKDALGLTSGGEKLTNAKWNSLRQEELYYWLCIHYEKQVSIFLDYVFTYFDEGYLSEYPLLADLLKDAEVASGRAVFWSQHLEQFFRYWEEENWEALLKVLTVFLDNEALELQSSSLNLLFFVKGYAYYQLQRFEESLDAYKRAVDFKPNDYQSLNNLGNTLAELRRYEEAAHYYQRAIDLNPADDMALFNLGNVLGDLQRHEEAIVAYRKALDIQPDKQAALHNLGNALSDLQRYEEALDAYEKALEINPQDAEILNAIGTALDALNRHEEAIKTYQKAIDIHPMSSHSYYNLGNTLRKVHRHEEAINAYQKAIDLDPKDYDPIHNMGVVLSDLQRYEKAVVAFQQAVDLAPYDPNVHFSMGFAFDELQRYEEAMMAYQQVIALKPSAYTAHYNLGIVLVKLQRLEEAITAFQQATELNPSDEDAFFNLGYTLGKLKRYEEAITAFQRTISLQPDYEQALLNLAFALRQQQRYEEAILIYDQAIQLEHPQYDALADKGWTQLLAGHVEAALRTLLDVWHKDNSNKGLAAMNLGHGHLLNNSATEALVWYQKSIPHWEDLTVFWEGMESDFLELRMEERGVARQQFDEIIATLKVDR